MPESIFSEEWRDCLRAHYRYVARMDDKITEKTLRGVMHEAGFTDEELKQLYILATAHVDQVGADFVPDSELLAETPVTETIMTAVALPQAVIEALLVEEAVESQEAVESEEAAEAENDSGEDELPKPDPNIKQLSLF